MGSSAGQEVKTAEKKEDAEYRRYMLHSCHRYYRWPSVAFSLLLLSDCVEFSDCDIRKSLAP